MTRPECLRASLGFFLIGVLGLGTSILVVWLGNRLYGSFDRQWPFLVLMFVYSIIGMMGVGGGLYLLVRAPFRPTSHPERIQVAFLKEYVAPDGLRRASLWESPDGSIIVLEQSRVLAGMADAPVPDGWGDGQVSAESITLAQAESLALDIIGRAEPGRDEDA